MELVISNLAVGAAMTRTVAAVLPDGWGRLGWRELGNKLDAFRWFQEGRAGVVPEAGRADAFTRLWRTEGAGYRRAERGPASPARPVSEAAAGLLPWQTGLGLSLAARALGAGGTGGPGAVAPALDRFLDGASREAAPGWEWAVIEALGLVARTLHPHRLAALDRELARRGGPERALFWHGVGRGAYFAPTRAVPSDATARRALEEASSEPGDEEGRAQAVAGLAWALTLVNLRSPEVVARFLASASATAPAEAIEHGVCAALLVGRGCGAGDGPGAEAVRRLLGPRTHLLDDLEDGLARTGRWQELFRFRPLERLAAELAAGHDRGTR